MCIFILYWRVLQQKIQISYQRQKIGNKEKYTKIFENKETTDFKAVVLTVDNAPKEEQI